MLLPTDGFGIYEDVATLANSAVYQPRLQAIANGGFKLVMNYSLLSGHIADLVAYINYAASQGMKVIVTLKDTSIWRDATYSTAYPQLFADSGNAPTGIAFMQYIVGQLKSLPGVWGWYVGDEVNASDHATFKPYADAIAAADSTHPRLFIQSGSQSFSVASGTSTFYDSCEVLGDDYYPIGKVPAGAYIYTTGQQAANIQTFDSIQGLKSAMVLQSFSFAEYSTPGAPYPALGDMTTALQAAMSNMAAKVILWYSYFDILRSDNPTLRWNNLTAVIASVQLTNRCR